MAQLQVHGALESFKLHSFFFSYSKPSSFNLSFPSPLSHNKTTLTHHHHPLPMLMLPSRTPTICYNINNNNHNNGNSHRINSVVLQFYLYCDNWLGMDPDKKFQRETKHTVKDPENVDCESKDMIWQLELGKPVQNRKPEKRVNGIYWILLLNIGIFVADHFFQVKGVKALYLYHNWPVWYQFVTATFCHANWSHLSSNLFFLYMFGKLVEEEEGNFALWISYILTGVGANLVSWLVLPRNAVSVGASGAVFGLFTISVLVKMSWDWRKILEVLILGQFVIEKVMEAAQASTSLRGGFAMRSVNHIAHLSGALVGVLLVWLLSKVPSDPSDR